MEQIYQKYRKIKNSILKNKIAVIVIGLICIIPIIYLINIFIYDEYTVVKTVPEKVKKTFKVYWEGFSVDQRESKLAQKGILLTYENGLTKYTGHKKTISSKFVLALIDVTDDYFVLLSGNAGMGDSGLLFFLLPTYSDIHIYNIRNFELIKKYHIRGSFSKAIIYNSKIYIEFNDKTYGYIVL